PLRHCCRGFARIARSIDEPLELLGQNANAAGRLLIRSSPLIDLALVYSLSDRNRMLQKTNTLTDQASLLGLFQNSGEQVLCSLRFGQSRRESEQIHLGNSRSEIRPRPARFFAALFPHQVGLRL